jgi:hypothetical protein
MAMGMVERIRQRTLTWNVSVLNVAFNISSFKSSISSEYIGTNEHSRAATPIKRHPEGVNDMLRAVAAANICIIGRFPESLDSE